MKYALISTIEPRESGYRVADVVESPFDVMDIFLWIPCNDEVVPDQYWYNPSNSSFIAVPAPKPPFPNQPISQGAQTL